MFSIYNLHCHNCCETVWSMISLIQMMVLMKEQLSLLRKHQASILQPPFGMQRSLSTVLYLLQFRNFFLYMFQVVTLVVSR